MVTEKEIPEEQLQAKTIAVKHVINPEEKNYVDVSNLAIGQTHSITMLLSYEKLFYKFVQQIRDTQKWYLERKYRRDFGKRWNKNEEHKEEFAKELALIIDNDTIDDKKLFINSFTQALFKVSRGKEGKLLEILEVLADTDMQTRAPEDPAEKFRNPMRSQ